MLVTIFMSSWCGNSDLTQNINHKKFQVKSTGNRDKERWIKTVSRHLDLEINRSRFLRLLTIYDKRRKICIHSTFTKLTKFEVREEMQRTIDWSATKPANDEVLNFRAHGWGLVPKELPTLPP